MRPTVVDAVIVKNKLILLMKRRTKPYLGYWALPGGHIEKRETAEQAVVREVKEETGVKIRKPTMFDVYSTPKRDPRGNISIVYISTSFSGKPKPNREAYALGWFPLNKLPKLGFDHRQIIKDAIKRKSIKG